jgi:hypothetical protein
MIIAALVAFAALLLAWLLAPSEPRQPTVMTPSTEVESLPRAA